MTIKKLHYISGLTITFFIGLHLFNHTWSIFGAERHIEMMRTLRLFYRNIFVETILLVAVLVQIISGLKLFNVNRKIVLTNFDKLHIWSGFYLAIFFIIHLSAVLSGRLFLHLDTNFYFGVAGLNSFPFNLFFIPYYGLAILSFFGHIASIHNKKMKQSVFGLTPQRQSFAILILGFILTIIIFYGLTNHFKGVAIPKEYRLEKWHQTKLSKSQKTNPANPKNNGPSRKYPSFTNNKPDGIHTSRRFTSRFLCTGKYFAIIYH